MCIRVSAPCLDDHTAARVAHFSCVSTRPPATTSATEDPWAMCSLAQRSPAPPVHSTHSWQNSEVTSHTTRGTPISHLYATQSLMWHPQSIAQCRFLKTVKCRHRNGYLVVKIFIKHDPGINLRPYVRKQKGMQGRSLVGLFVQLILMSLQSTERPSWISQMYTTIRHSSRLTRPVFSFASG